MDIFNMEQGTPEWFAARAGIPTASEFSTVMASGRGGGESKTRRTYMLKLAGERITGEPAESYQNAAMNRGKALEDDARQLYAFKTEADLVQVGFIRNGAKGCSPDSLVGSDGMLEIKTQAPHLLIDTMQRGDAPPEHKAQCQGALWVAEREWIDLVIYYPKMPFLRFRLERDEGYIRQMAAAVREFNEELEELVGKVKHARGGWIL